MRKLFVFCLLAMCAARLFGADGYLDNARLKWTPGEWSSSNDGVVADSTRLRAVLVGLNERMGDFATSIDALASSGGSAGTSISLLETRDGELGASLWTLESWKGSAASSIGLLDAWRGTAGTSIGNLDTWRGSAATSIGLLDGWRGSAGTSIGSLDTWRGSAAASIDTLQSGKLSSSGGTIGGDLAVTGDLGVTGELTVNQGVFVVGSQVFLGGLGTSASDLSANQASFYLDETNGKLRVKVKYSGGSVMYGELAVTSTVP